jgi:hypothetical protein
MGEACPDPPKLPASFPTPATVRRLMKRITLSTGFTARQPGKI